jgi:hypothetical protein
VSEAFDSEYLSRLNTEILASEERRREALWELGSAARDLAGPVGVLERSLHTDETVTYVGEIGYHAEMEKAFAPLYAAIIYAKRPDEAAAMLATAFQKMDYLAGALIGRLSR